MAGFSAIALGLGAATTVAGTIISANAQARMAREQEQATKRAENARQQQSQLDASRRRREAFRQAMVARATALATGVNQGAQFGSGVEGGIAQVTATGIQNQNTVTQAEHLGERVFAANRDHASATARGQRAVAWGGALTSLGGALMNNAGAIGRLGEYMTTPRGDQANPYNVQNPQGFGQTGKGPQWQRNIP